MMAKPWCSWTTIAVVAGVVGNCQHGGAQRRKSKESRGEREWISRGGKRELCLFDWTVQRISSFVVVHMSGSDRSD
jgi:hypothetical protein